MKPRALARGVFILTVDPLETRNLIDEEKEIFENLKVKLDNYTTKASQVSGVLENKNIKFIKPLDKDTQEQLKNLGYN